jgi:hypothetical protein
MINYLLAWADFCAHQVTWWNLMDEYLFDIPLAEYLYHGPNGVVMHDI